MRNIYQMMCYSIESRNQIFVKGYGFFSLAKNTSQSISKNVKKKLSDKCRPKFLDDGVIKLSK